MIKIDKVRFNSSEKFFNRFFVYSGTIYYVVRRPKSERPLHSVEKIMSCKSIEDLYTIGGTPAPKGGKFSLEDYLQSMGIN
jgi:hypothetical protein